MINVAGLHRVVWRVGLTVTVVLCGTLPAAASDTAEALRERYAAQEPKLHASVFDAPIYVESDDRNGTLRGEIYGVLARPFSLVRTHLQQLSSWCALLTLHFNIKACTYHNDDGTLQVYSGGKGYENPQKARQTEFVYMLHAASPEFFHASFSSAGGPFDTYDYRLDIQAIPLNGQTFAHVRFSYRYRLFTRMMSATYFATLGRNKIGFSAIGTDKSGNPIYVKGRIGAVERNIMRYYLGLQALFESLTLPEEQRFEWRLRRWFSLTETYARQLHELDEEEYLEAKRRERLDMLPQAEARPAK